MRNLRSIAASAGIAALAVALAGTPAGAKGPRSATIDGPGIDTPIEEPAGVLSKLPDLAGVYGPLWDDTMAMLLDEPPTDDLGPGYEIAWDLGDYVDEAGQSTGSPNVVRQTVYPYAAGSPLVYTEAGQPFYAGETSGGWFVAHPALRDLLIEMGVPTRLEVEELSAAAQPAGARGGGGGGGDPTRPADGGDAGDAGWVLPAALAAVGVTVLAASTYGLARRRTA